MEPPPGVVLYFASVRGCARAASAERRLRTLLAAKGVAFREVDVAEEAGGRAAMRAASGTAVTPQLHAGGRFVGLFERVQELEDEGTLSGVLRHFGSLPGGQGCGGGAGAAAGGAGAPEPAPEPLGSADAKGPGRE